MQPPGSYWEVVIKGHPADLEFLTLQFTDSNLSIVATDKSFSMRSAEFAPDERHDVVRTLAERKLGTLAGIVFLARGLERPLEIDAMHLRRPDGSHDTAIAIKGVRATAVPGNVSAVQKGAEGIVSSPAKSKAVIAEQLASK